MTALDFPSSPTLGQTFISHGVTFVWDGVKWNKPIPRPVGYTGSQGITF